MFKTLVNLKETIENHGFKTTKEEIYFFKYIKTEPMRFLIYFIEVRSCELCIPKIGREQQLEYLNLQVEKVNTFFNKNTELLLYFENDYTYFDKYYFTRIHLNHSSMVKSYPYFKDPYFNTSHDGVWSRIKGLFLYIDYLKKRIMSFRKEENTALKGNDKLLWTGSYAAFVEMAYGCLIMGYFNNGNIGITKAIEKLGDFLGVERGNSSRTYYEIKSRKSSQIKFFEETGQKLLQKMKDDDEIQ